MTSGREQGDPRPAGPADDHRGRHVELGEQTLEDIGLHRGLRFPAEAHLRLAGVRAIPDHHAIAALGECDGELADPGRVPAEATTRRHDPWAPLTDDLVRDRQSLDLVLGIGQTLTPSASRGLRRRVVRADLHARARP